ncbi:MAG: ABC-2 family transporter protein [Lachnospiraceae bacterium]|nr:ABC-2 family transporter protein [Lachnospiraceae bacterium]
MSKLLKTAEIGLQQSIVYKNNFLLGFVSGAFGLVVQLVFWPVLFSSGTEFGYASIESTTIAGYYLNEMITYSVLVYFIQRGTSMMNIGSIIQGDITSGGLNIHLIRPIKYLWTKWIMSISGQLINFGLSIFVFLCISILLKANFAFPEAAVNVFLVVLFVFFAYILSFLINCIIGLLAFWLLEVNSLNTFVGMGVAILSGAIFPLDFITTNFGVLLKYLPFSYLAFIPTQVYLGKFSFTDVIHNIAICFSWIGLLIIVTKKLWENGIRRYSAFGG